MNQEKFTIEAFKLLGEINDFTDYYEINSVEKYYHQYKALLTSTHFAVPTRALSNLPFIAMGVQMAKIKSRPESKKRHAKRTCKWLKTDLEFLLSTMSLSSQAA